MTDTNLRLARIGARTRKAPTDTSSGFVQPMTIPGKTFNLVRVEVFHRVPGAAAKRLQEVRSYQHGDIVNLEPEHDSGLLSRETSWKATKIQQSEI